MLCNQCIHFYDKKPWKNYLILRCGMTISSMAKNSFYQPLPDALGKNEITLASTDSIPVGPVSAFGSNYLLL